MNEKIASQLALLMNCLIVLGSNAETHDQVSTNKLRVLSREEMLEMRKARPPRDKYIFSEKRRDEIRKETTSRGFELSQQLSNSRQDNGSTNQVDTLDTRVLHSLTISKQWIENVFYSGILPKYTVEYLCIENWNGERDLIRTKWRSEKYLFEVTQTVSVFNVKVTPHAGFENGQSIEQKVDQAKQVCYDIFNKSLDKKKYTNGFEFSSKPPDRVAEYMVNTLFLKDDFQIFDNIKTNEIIAGHLISPEPVGSTSTYQYAWYDVVSWWHNGESVTFYFQKPVIGRSQSLFNELFSSRRDAKWFGEKQPIK